MYLRFPPSARHLIPIYLAFLAMVGQAATSSPELTAGSVLPPIFVPNAGQAEDAVRFIVETPDVRAAFTTDSAIFHIHGARLRMQFAGASATTVSGLDELPGRANFLIGRDPHEWHTGLPTYRGVIYRELYPGIDATYGGSGQHLKSEFLVAPHADPTRIRMRYPDAQNMGIEPDGSLHVTAGDVEFREAAPVVYQITLEGVRVSVEARYLIGRGQSVTFALGPYDPAISLVIDPVITYSTYLGGSGTGAVTAVARDGIGNLYAAGWTESMDFPIAGAAQAINRGGVDAFVVKLSADGSSLLYATYIGGLGDDRAAGIAVDSLGQAYVAGATGSSDFPMLAAARSTFAGGKEGFALKLNAVGSGPVYSTYVGGSGYDLATAIAVDASGNAYVAGDTYSADYGVVNPVQASLGGNMDGFLTKLDLNGARVFSTFLGGSLDDHVGGIAVDGTGNAVLAGGTFSTNFPVIAAIQGLNAGGQDVFVTKLETTAPAQIIYSTYLGSTGGNPAAPEQANAIALDSSGNAYVTGVVSSAGFPVTPGTFQASFAGSRDVFVTKLNAAGSARLYSTYLGWTGFDWANGIGVDAAGNAYIAGYTSSVSFANVGGVQSGFKGLYDAFLSKLNPTGNGLSFSTLYGGTGSDQANAIAVDANGNMFAGGQTNSFDFPVLGAVQNSNHGGATGWLARIGVTPVPTQLPSADSASIVYGSGGAATVTARFSHPAGATALTSVAVLLSRTTSIDFACYITYNPVANTFTLANNVAASGGGTVTPGSGSAANDQCQLLGAGSSRTLSGTNLTLTLSLVLDIGFPGNNTVYLYAADANVNTGWVAKSGVSQVSADSVSPNSGTGASDIFTFVFSDTQNASNVLGMAMLFNSSVTFTDACSLVYDRNAGTISLRYDNGAGATPKPLNNNATVQNSACAVGVVTLTTSGTSNILTVPLAFKGQFTGPKNIYMYATGATGNTGWVQRGTYNVLAGGVPVANSVLPASGSGSGPQLFSFNISDNGGSSFLVGAAMLITSPVGFNQNNSCNVVYDRNANRLSLSANTIANGSAGLTIGSFGSVSNSYCTLYGSGSTVSIGSTSLVITLNLSFSTAFPGAKKTYLYASEVGYNSGWVQVGTWTVPDTLPTVLSISPSSGTGTQQSFVASVSTAASPTNLTKLSFLVTAQNLANACYVEYNRSAGVIGLYSDDGLMVATKPLGSSLTMENSQCAVGFSSVTVSGGTVSLTVLLVFKTPQFSGSKGTYAMGENAVGSTGFYPKGNWIVP
ncbi:MAG: SBBP repeat-containing protein [Acidobacteriota bacterium]